MNNTYTKYPRTPHLYWSGHLSKQDKYIETLDNFIGKRVVVTEKYDGQNTSCYNDHIHARSLDGKNVAMDWVKNYWQTFRFNIPDGWRVCGEDLTYKHSIKYNHLKSFFYGFSVWNEKNTCLSWDESLEWFSLLGITPVEVIYDGIYEEEKIKALWNPKDWETKEGYVLRLADSFSYKEFKTSVGKFVRDNHVQTTKHWMFGHVMEKNELEK